MISGKISTSIIQADHDNTEHVLKQSASHPGLSSGPENRRPPGTRPNDHSSMSSNTAVRSSDGSTLGKKPSPTPSVKRGKAEKLIKEHGSPPNVRVTAGGNVVPNSVFTPLGSPRFAYNSFNRNGHRGPHRFGPNYIYSYPNSGPQDLYLPDGYVMYNPYGELCQVLHGNLLPLRITDTGPQMLIAPTNWPFPPLPNNGVTYPFANQATGNSGKVQDLSHWASI
jgi:hypothetical protein